MKGFFPKPSAPVGLGTGWPRVVSHPRLPQIRTCGTTASGSSIERSLHDNCRTPVGPFSPCRDLLSFCSDGQVTRCSRHRPFRRCLNRSAASLSWGSARVRSPRSTVLSADSDCSVAIAPHFVAFAWRYLAVGPVRSRRLDQRRQAGAASSAVPAPRLGQGTTERSQVPGRPVRTCPALRPRRSLDIRPLRCRNCCLPVFRIRRLRWTQ